MALHRLKKENPPLLGKCTTLGPANATCLSFCHFVVCVYNIIITVMYLHDLRLTIAFAILNDKCSFIVEKAVHNKDLISLPHLEKQGLSGTQH